MRCCGRFDGRLRGVDEDDAIEIEPPLRRNGTPKRFWYQPGIGMHICHMDGDGYVSMICVGHSE